MLVDIP
jgi:hypothetical protein